MAGGAVQEKTPRPWFGYYSAMPHNVHDNILGAIGHTPLIRLNAIVRDLFSAAFAVLATLLAAIGLYGVLAYLVTQRTREIGVRMALGADAGRVRGMVLGQVGRMALVGGVIGTAVAIAAGRAARSMLFGLVGHDPIAIGGAAVVLGVVAFSAGYLPARRASIRPAHSGRGRASRPGRESSPEPGPGGR